MVVVYNNYVDYESAEGEAMEHLDINSLDWQKMNGLLPAIIQNAENGQILMLGYMNEEALMVTLTSGQLTLYSRSRERLWRKGETSGNSMALEHISADYDNDSLLVQVTPKGPACHLGYTSRYQPPLRSALGNLDSLIELINECAELKSDDSYTATLLQTGIYGCAQKLGVESIELVVAAASNQPEELIQESADVLFHLLILLKAYELSFYEVLQCLQEKSKTIYT